MPEQSRAAVMLEILKKQYRPEAETLEKSGHVPHEGQEFASQPAFTRSPAQPAVKRRVDPDAWLRQKLAEHGVSAENMLAKPVARTPLQPKVEITPSLPQQQAQIARKPLPSVQQMQPVKLQPVQKTQPVQEIEPVKQIQPVKQVLIKQAEPVKKIESIKTMQPEIAPKIPVEEIPVKVEPDAAKPQSNFDRYVTAEEVPLEAAPEIEQIVLKKPAEKKSILDMFKHKKKETIAPAKPAIQSQSQLEYSLEKGMQRQLDMNIQAEKAAQAQMEKPKKSLRGSLYRKLVSEKAPHYPKFSVEHEKLVAILPREEVKQHHVVYPLIKPFAYASIRWDPEENSMVYHIIEPDLTDDDKHILVKLKEGLIQVINVSFEDIKHHSKMVDFLEENVRKLLYEYDFNVDDQQYMRIMYYVFRDFIGLNEIEPFLRDPYIEDIGADGVGIPIYIIHQRYGSLKTNVVYNDEERMKEFVTKLAERCDRYISYAEPLLDGTLPDGTRVNATLSGDVTTRGPTFSVRKFRETPFTPVDIVKFNTASPEMLAYLWFVVQNRSNVLLAGGVSTGKTSFLNCLSLFIPPESKIVSIEDTRELSLPHENWIPSVSRAGFTGTGVGEVTMFELLRESFRQNPDYLIVGEIRGKEAYVMFQAMASGHPSMSTMHAGSVDDVIKRLQTKPIGLSAGLLEVLDLVIVMVHARDKGKSARRVKEVVELQSVDIESGRARVSKSFVWLPAIDNFEFRGDSWVLHKISKEKGIPMDTIIREISQRKKLINWMVENNITELKEVVKYINTYYREPDKLKDILESASPE